MSRAFWLCSWCLAASALQDVKHADTLLSAPEDARETVSLLQTPHALQSDRHLALGQRGNDMSWLLFIFGFAMGAILCGLVPLVFHAHGRSIVRALECASDYCDRAGLGVDVDLGKVSANLGDGVVLVHGMTIFNPPGYSSDYLLKVKKVKLELSLSQFFWSNFRTVAIDKLVLRGVDIVYDKSWRSSNVNDALIMTESEALPKKQGEVEWAEWQETGKAPRKAEVHREDSVRVTLKSVELEDVGVRMAHEMLKGAGLRMSLDNITFSDFGSHSGVDATLPATSRSLLRSILKTVRATIASKRTAERKP